MARNGSGSYTAPSNSWNPALYAKAKSRLDGVRDAVETCLDKTHLEVP